MNLEIILGVISNHFFSLFCHQDPSILIEIAGKNIMLCPRCSGLHMSFFISLFYFSIEKRKRTYLSGLTSKLICFAGITIIILEWLFARFSIITPTILSRLTSGLVAGSIICILMLLYRRKFIFKSNHGQNFSWKSIIGITGLSLIIGLFVFQLESWTFITILLVMVVLVNITFLLQTILLRLLSFLNLKIMKTLMP
ncbi:MAG: DUF2085 domain-containing protein [Bacteroidales bacterium]